VDLPSLKQQLSKKQNGPSNMLGQLPAQLKQMVHTGAKAAKAWAGKTRAFELLFT